MSDEHTTVLVVGAGPVGLTASILLSLAGIDHVVVDRRDGPHRAPQAHVVNPRSLEIFRQMGVDLEALRGLATPREDGSHVRWVSRLAGELLGSLPYERQGDENLAATPTPLLNLSQHLLEPVLLERRRAIARDAVRYRHTCETVQQDDDCVTAVIRERDSSATHTIRSRYLLAADGAASRVRRSLGIEMIGPDSLQSFVMMHFEANLRELVRDRPAILYWLLDPDTPGALVAHDIDRTWVLMHPFDPTLESDANFPPERCEQLIRAALGSDVPSFSLRDKSLWTMTAQVAERYRSGRVFLVGDSAHRFPPTGGMGMNTGIQDAHNLVWKIVAVEAGWGEPAILDTYEVERRPVALNNTEQSLNNALKMFEVFAAVGASDDREASRAKFRAALVDPTARAALATAIDRQREHFDMFGLQLGFRYESGALVGDGRSLPACDNPVRDFVQAARSGSRLPHAWVTRDGARISTLDLVARNGLTLITRRDGAAWAARIAEHCTAPVHLLIEGRDFVDHAGEWAALCEVEQADALLVRPDQHVAWYASGTPGAVVTQPSIPGLSAYRLG